jgi:hypothetical protein
MQLASKKVPIPIFLLFLPLQEKARNTIKILSQQSVKKTATNPPPTMLTLVRIQKEPKSLKISSSIQCYRRRFNNSTDHVVDPGKDQSCEFISKFSKKNAIIIPRKTDS